jgi:hypothetical protein
MDRLGQLLAPYRGWDPRTPAGRYVAVGGGRHAKPFTTVDEPEDAGATYFRAGCRRAAASPTSDGITPAEDRAV